MDPASDRLIAMLRHPSMIGGGRGRTSPVHAWMVKRRREIERALAEGRPNWKALAEAMAAEGITDGTGKAPTGERCRKTWWAVQQAAKAVAVHEAAPAPPPRPFKPAPTREERTAREMADLQRRYEAGKLPAYPKPPALQPKPVPEPIGEIISPTPPPEPVPPPRADDPVARIKAGWEAQKAKMPKPMW